MLKITVRVAVNSQYQYFEKEALCVNKIKITSGSITMAFILVPTRMANTIGNRMILRLDLLSKTKNISIRKIENNES
jgi:hypothetical protein